MRPMTGLSTVISLILTRIATSTSIRNIDNPIGHPPLIQDGPPPDTIIYHVGQRLTLPCRAQGSPPPRYQWYQNGRLLDPILDTEASFYVIHPAHLGNLHIRTKHLVTSGYYQCLASNDYGVAMSNITRLQEAVFEDLQPRRLTHNLTTVDGRHLVLRCNHVTSVPPPTVYWFTAEMTSRSPRQSHYSIPIRTNERLATDDTGGLVIVAVTKSDARIDLVYKCDAYNYVIRQTIGGDYFKIQVQEEPYDTGLAPELIYSSTKVTGHVGHNVTLTCIFSGRPLARMNWTRRGASSLPVSAKMADYGRRLVLTNVSLDDEGLYACSAANEMAVTKYSVSLTVVASPTISVFPENRNTTDGESESFTCHGEGHPLPFVTWFINAQPINSSSVKVQWEVGKETLTLFNLQPEDTSTITCNVSNDFGYILASAYLRVIPIQSTSPVVVTDESTVRKTSSDYSDDVTNFVTSSFNDADVETSEDDLNNYETHLPEDIAVTTSSSDDRFTVDSIYSVHENGVFDLSRDKKELDSDVRGEGVELTDSFLVKSVWFLIPILLLIVFGFIVWQRYRNRKTSYRVEEQEKKHGGGANGVDYDSEDSGYDEQRAADRRIKRFEMAETAAD